MIPLLPLCMTTLLGVSPGVDDVDVSCSVPSWFEGNYNAALREARQRDQPVLLAFLPEWSDYSVRMAQEVFVDPAVGAALGERVCLVVDPDDPQGAQVARLHAVSDYPCLAFLDARGRPEDRIVGFIPAGPLVGQLQRIDAGSGTVSGLRALADAAPDDLDLRFALADQLGWVGKPEQAAALYDSIRDDDPSGASQAGARLILTDEVDAIRDDAGGVVDPATFDLARLGRRVATLGSSDSRVLGWNQVAGMARQFGREAEAVDAWRQAWGSLDPQDDLVAWCNTTVRTITEARDELAADSLEFALEVGRAGLAAAEAAWSAEPEPGSEAARSLAESVDALAFAHFAVGELDAALALVERAVSLDPDNEEYANRAAFFVAEA